MLNSIVWSRTVLGLQNIPTASPRGVRLPQRVSWIWHQTIWWWGSCSTEASGNAVYLFIAIDSRTTLAQSSSTWEIPIYGLNRIKQCTYAKLKCLYFFLYFYPSTTCVCLNIHWYYHCEWGIKYDTGNGRMFFSASERKKLSQCHHRRGRNTSQSSNSKITK